MTKFPDGLALSALEASAEGIVLVDGQSAEQPVVWVNRAFEKLTGFSADDLLGSNLRVLQGGDRDQAERVALHEAMAQEKPCRVVLRNYRADGSVYWNDLGIVPLRDAQGALWWVGFSRDVSAQREMEIMLGRRSEELDAAQRKLVEVDPVDRLTGLQTERSFEIALELAWFSCARDRRSLVLFLFAPDAWDVYLDTFGRVAGDSGLRMLARSVGSAFRRASDVTGRIGDARFAALGVEMDRGIVESHARRVCDRVRALAIHNPRAPTGRILTMSAMVALAQPDRSADWRALLETATQGLAAAQARGIEQVVLTDSPEIAAAAATARD